MFSVAYMFKGKDRSIHTWGRGNCIRGLGPNCKKWRLVLEDCPIVKHGDCVSDRKKKEKRPLRLSLLSSLLGQIAFPHAVFPFAAFQEESFVPTIVELKVLFCVRKDGTHFSPPFVLASLVRKLRPPVVGGAGF